MARLAVVAVNRFPTDTDAEIDLVVRKCRELGVNTILSTVWADGGKGGEDLAREVVRLCEAGSDDFAFSYDVSDSIEDKLNVIVRRVYGGSGAARSLRRGQRPVLPESGGRRHAETADGQDDCRQHRKQSFHITSPGVVYPRRRILCCIVELTTDNGQLRIEK